MTRKDCYVILGLREGASLEDVKKAYRKRAFELHPDLNPSDQASKQFQELNEAYVLMLTWLEEDASLKASSAVRAKTSAQPNQPNRANQANGPNQSNWANGSKPNEAGKSAQAPNAEGKKTKQDFSKSAAAGGPAFGASSSGRSGSPGNFSASATCSPANSPDRERHISQQQVMDNVLRDPFARRVFEDIYSEIKRGGSGRSGQARHNQPKLGDALALKTGRDVVHSVKGWLRKQIDDEQVVEVDATNLRPGVRIRLQIQQGMSGKLQNIEVTLPLDYLPGRPIRLRGLGRKIGPWLGDLYIRIMPKPFKI